MILIRLLLIADTVGMLVFLCGAGVVHFSSDLHLHEPAIWAMVFGLIPVTIGSGLGFPDYVNLRYRRG